MLMHELSSATISLDDDVIGVRGSITVHENKTGCNRAWKLIFSDIKVQMSPSKVVVMKNKDLNL